VKILLFLLRLPDEGSSQGAYLKAEHREGQTSTSETGTQAYSHDVRRAQGNAGRQNGNTAVHLHVLVGYSVVRLHSVERWDDKTNDKLEGSGHGLSEAIIRYSLRGIERNDKISVSQDSPCLRRDSNQIPPEYESTVLPLHQSSQSTSPET
jgi:hypothetical protein